MKIDLKKLDKAWLFFGPLFLLILGLDQASKFWALKNLRIGESVDFGFALSYNDGILWGMDMPEWLIWILTFAVISLGAWIVIENKLWKDKADLSGLAFLLAGAVGNSIDRFRLGYVIDFIKIYWWPNFNLADAYIVIGVGILFWEFVIKEEFLGEN